MNYYPANFYSNYPQPQSIYGYNQNQMPSYQAPQSQLAASNNQIPGKIVDSQEVARVSDIPLGGYGIFPKADLREVYIKIDKFSRYKKIVESIKIFYHNFIF